MVATTVFFLKSMFFKSAGSISEIIFIQSTQILHTFFIRLSSKIRSGFLISEKLSDLWPVFDDVVVKNTNFDFKLTQMYQYIQYFKNLIRILLDLFIINKIKIFVFFLQQELLHVVIIN